MPWSTNAAAEPHFAATSYRNGAVSALRSAAAFLFSSHTHTTCSYRAGAFGCHPHRAGAAGADDPVAVPPDVVPAGEVPPEGCIVVTAAVPAGVVPAVLPPD